jgi:hypothetical protein
LSTAEYQTNSVPRVTRLDRTVIAVVLALLLVLGVIVLMGDRVGVQLTQVAPLDAAHSTSGISIRFNEAMDHDSVTQRFRTEPELEGMFSWSGATMTFQPAEALRPGEAYTVALEPGAVSESGRAVLSEYRYSFTVAEPRVAYLFPADGSPFNIWIVDPADPSNPEQITNSPSGVYDFGVSPDGSKIAFAENNLNGGGSDIKLLDLESGALQQLTNCQRALCTSPVWRPDGRMIAYMRVEDDPQFGSSPPRIWLLDLTTTPATTRPLFQQSQILGYGAQWSADGSRIALVDRGSVAILIYDFASDHITSISSQAGDTGTLSPDGTRLVYPELVSDPSGALVNKLRMVTVDTGEFETISSDDDSVNDQRAVWNPDGRILAIARQDQSVARTIQIVLYDMETGDTTPLTVDLQYSNLLFFWDPTGTELVVQRFAEAGVPSVVVPANPSGEAASPEAAPTSGKPEIWTFDATTGEGKLLVINGFFPRWVP